MNNYPFIKCLHPVRIANRSTGEPIIVGCGKCAACIGMRAAQMTLKCNLESQAHRYCYFITLTYDEVHLPVMHPVPIAGTNGQEHYFISTCKRLKERGKLIATSVISKRQINELYKKIGNPEGIPYLSVREAQLFIKRLRKNIEKCTNEKIRYFLCGEYGGKHLRPHYHILVWFSREETKQSLGNLVNQSWQFGRTDSQLVTKSASSYVASYVNNSCDLPDLYSESKLKQFSLHSTFLGEKFYRGKKKEIYSLSPQEFIRRSERINDSISTFVLWRSLKDTFYPKCRDYAALSTSERKFLYCLYDSFRTRKATYRRPARLAQEIIREAETKIYLRDLVYDDVADISKYYDDELNISANYECLQHAKYLHEQGLFDDDEYMEAVERYATHYDYCKQYIYRDLALSKQFLEFVCDGSTNPIHIDACINMIEYFYMSIDLSNLNDQLKTQETLTETMEFEVDDFEFFYDAYDISKLLKNHYYKRYKAYVKEQRNLHRKHKQQQDANRILYRESDLIH